MERVIVQQMTVRRSESPRCSCELDQNTRTGRHKLNQLRACSPNTIKTTWRNALHGPFFQIAFQIAMIVHMQNIAQIFQDYLVCVAGRAGTETRNDPPSRPYTQNP